MRVEALKPEHRRETGTNKGVVITAVVERSAAFKADLLVGDIIVGVGGEPIEYFRRFSEVVIRYYGVDDVEFELFRNGRKLSKRIDIDDGAAPP